LKFTIILQILIWLAIWVPVQSWSANSDVGDRVEKPVRDAIDIRQKTQKERDLWREERRKLVDAYEESQRVQKQLEAQKESLTQSSAAVRTRIADKAKQLADIEQISVQIQPFLSELIKRLHQQFNDDMPFLPGERGQRLDTLDRLIMDPHVSVSEKFRKIMEALMVEAEYGRTIEVPDCSFLSNPGSEALRILQCGLRRMESFAQILQFCDSNCHGYWAQTPAGGAADPAHRKDDGKMKPLLSLVMMGILPLMVLSTPLYGRDMRELQVRAQQTKEALMQKAAEELKAAEQEAAEGRNRIINDKSALKTAIDKVNVQNRQLQQEVEKLTVEHRAMEEKENILSQNLAETDSMVRELVGVIRVNAKDMSALITENLQTALTGNTSDFLEDIAGQSKFPGMEDIRRMADMLFDQIKMSGEVTLTKGIMINRSGSEVEADILALGCFTAAYRLGSEVGFLSYSESGRKLYALSRLPSGRLKKQILRYMEGREEAVPLDVSRGAALRQLTHELSLWQQIPKGGPIVWPILAILGIGIAIVIERVIFLMRRRFDADRVIGRIDTLAAHQDWDACRKACAPFEEKAVVRVVKAGLDCYHLAREEMENALQEAILKEIPPMERYLSTLGMLAAIAPLLGLLGTVTGMIDTFHVITQHGTGDPRMMSGGISVALVTTMLGLSVAIPIMLAHTLLSRAVDNIIGQMEEKAVALVNIVHKNRGV